MRGRRLTIGFLATLPPTKGVSDYVVAYLSNTPSNLRFNCYPIAQLAPDALYPGGGAQIEEDSGVKLPKNVRVVDNLSYYGLSGWVRSGLASNVDVFHIHWWTPFLLVPYLLLMAILQARGVKTVLTLHNVTAHENKFLHDLGTRLLLTMTDHIIVHTKSGKGRLVNSFGVNPAKISVLAHGLLKPREMAMSEKGAAAREKLGLPHDKTILLFFGNIRPYKGLDILLESMKTVQSKEKDVILMVAGMPWKGGDVVRESVEQLGLSQHVVLRLAFVPPDELPLYFESSDIVVLPYRHFDAQTGVGAYALFFEKPMVVTRVGGLPELVLDESVIVPPEDSESLAETILRVVRDESLRSQLSEDSRSLKEEYDWERITRDTAEIYSWLARED